MAVVTAVTYARFEQPLPQPLSEKRLGRASTDSPGELDAILAESKEIAELCKAAEEIARPQVRLYTTA